MDFKIKENEIEILEEYCLRCGKFISDIRKDKSKCYVYGEEYKTHIYK